MTPLAQLALLALGVLGLAALFTVAIALQSIDAHLAQIRDEIAELNERKAAGR